MGNLLPQKLLVTLKMFLLFITSLFFKIVDIVDFAMPYSAARSDTPTEQTLKNHVEQVSSLNQSGNI